jgi:alkanesulfonate monooxygenase SsuD/methylene tetrahydromethanopterin reductase-like flavin-dependent oxidoreductase (luciferase family)
MAAAATRRVRLMTEILISPLRNGTLLAKEAATLDAFSRGRLTLGLGVGQREDDFIATGAKNYKRRGKYIEEQIAEMRHVWSGKPWDENTGPVGPAPVQSGGPEIMLGGFAPAVFQRVARLANGLITPLNDFDQVGGMFRLVEQAWQEASRPGKPRLIAQIDIGLETPHNDTAIDDVLSYYKITPPYDVYKSSTLIRTDQQLRDKLKAAEQVGTDEVILFTWSTDINQIERIADIIG